MYKLKRALSALLSLAMLASMLVVPTSVSAEEEVVEEVKYQRLKILEIQPSDNYMGWTENTFSSYVDADATDNPADYETVGVEITRMTMKEFVCHVEAINGMYDIVVIGCKDGKYYPYGPILSKYHLAETNYGGHSISSGYLAQDGAVVQEYYSDNDITNLCAEKIKEFKESGQLLCLSERIFSSSYTDRDTKLYANFGEYQSDSTVLKFADTANATSLATTMMEYYAAAAKRPGLEITARPTEYLGEDDDYIDKFIGFRFNSKKENELAEESMLIELYIDHNGDGVYKETELEETMTVVSAEGYTMNVPLEQTLSGFYNWKVVLTDSLGAKHLKTGKVAFHGTEKTVIRVLQIAPYQDKYDMTNPDNLKSLTSGDLTNPNEDIEIKLDRMLVPDYEQLYVDDPSYTLNGRYDMVIFGFDDWRQTNYGEWDLDIDNAVALHDLKNFVETDQSLMLTHDTISFEQERELIKDYGEAKAGQFVKGHQVTKYFRDLIGQNRYVSDEMPGGTYSASVPKQTVTQTSTAPVTTVEILESSAEKPDGWVAGTTVVGPVTETEYVTVSDKVHDKIDTITTYTIERYIADGTAYQVVSDTETSMNKEGTHTTTKPSDYDTYKVTDWSNINYKTEETVTYNADNTERTTTTSYSYYYSYESGSGRNKKTYYFLVTVKERVVVEQILQGTFYYTKKTTESHTETTRTTTGTSKNQTFNTMSFGYTDYALNRAVSNYYPEYGKAWANSTTVEQLNSGLITSYPYPLNEDITVSPTHAQYYQLDLENPDVVVWYTLDSAGKDGRNGYYTYSCGTVTFSGTGHSDLSAASDAAKVERELFINTIVKAARGANKAPKVSINGLVNGQKISKTSGMEFTYVATDVDFDDQELTAEIYINGEKYGNTYTVQNGIMENVIIDSETLAELLGENNYFTLKVVVWDDSNASGFDTRDLKYITDAVLEAKVDNTTFQVLTGDAIDVNFTVTPANITEDVLFTDVYFNLGKDGANGMHHRFEGIDEGIWWADEEYEDGTIKYISEVGEISDMSTIEERQLYFEIGDAYNTSGELLASQAGSYSIGANVSYMHGGDNFAETHIADCSFSVDVKSGTIAITVNGVNASGAMAGVEGVEFYVTNGAGEMVAAGVTDETGKAVVNGLCTDDYEVVLKLTEEQKQQYIGAAADLMTQAYVGNCSLNYENNLGEVNISLEPPSIENVTLLTEEGYSTVAIVKNYGGTIDTDDYYTNAVLTFTTLEQLQEVQFGLDVSFANCKLDNLISNYTITKSDGTEVTDLVLSYDAVDATFVVLPAEGVAAVSPGNYVIKFLISTDTAVDTTQLPVATGDKIAVRESNVMQLEQFYYVQNTYDDVRIDFEVREPIFTEVQLLFNGNRRDYTSVKIVDGATVFFDVVFELDRGAKDLGAKLVFNGINASKLNMKVIETVQYNQNADGTSTVGIFDGATTLASDGTITLTGMGDMTCKKYIATVSVDLYSSTDAMEGNVSVPQLTATEIEKSAADVYDIPTDMVIKRDVSFSEQANVI